MTLSDVDFESGIISVTKTYNHLNVREMISTPKTPSSVRKVSMPVFWVDELNNGNEIDDELLENIKLIINLI